MPTGHLAKEAGRTCIITMVHGTWGRGFFPKEYRAQPRSWWHRLRPIAPPPWFHEGSVFRSRLESELRKENIATTFRPFEWSGANSVFHRARAADELNSLLVSDPDDANSIVIAHSHGGNVAFRAISTLGSRGARIHLITLATPFLRVFPTWSGPSFWEVAMYFSLVIATGVALLWPEGLGLDNFLAEVALWLVLCAVMSFLLALIVNPSPPPAKRQLAQQTKRWVWQPFKIAEATNYDSTGPHAPNLLVIRGVDDEAALALAFVGIATAINRVAVGLIWKYFLPLLFLCLVGLMLIMGSEFDFDKVWTRLYFVFVFATLTLLWVPALFNSWFGREFLIGATRCEIAADSAPESRRSRIITLETPYPQWPPGPPWPLRQWPRSSPTWQKQSSTAGTSRMRHKIY